jgi:hypothetical protein
MLFEFEGGLPQEARSPNEKRKKILFVGKSVDMFVPEE